jgi:hypothetical protein
MEKICECGVKFEATSTAKYCIDCRGAKDKERKREWKAKHFPPKKNQKKDGKKICRHCYRLFVPEASASQFCSDTCREAHTKLNDSRSRTRTRERKMKDLKVIKVESHAFSVFNQTRKNIDAEILKRRRIKSPNLERIQFRYFDMKMKTTYYFKTKERMESFIQKHA